jgi:hypothetical protein
MRSENGAVELGKIRSPGAEWRVVRNTVSFGTHPFVIAELLCQAIHNGRNEIARPPFSPLQKENLL